MTEQPSPVPDEREPLRLIEVGWIIAGELEGADFQAVVQVHQRVLKFCQSRFPEFIWRMPLLRRNELVQGMKVEPVELLRQ